MSTSSDDDEEVDANPVSPADEASSVTVEVTVTVTVSQLPPEPEPESESDPEVEPVESDIPVTSAEGASSVESGMHSPSSS